MKLYYLGSTSIIRFAHPNSDLTVYQGANMEEIIVSYNGDPVSSFMEVYSVTGSKVYSSQFQISQGENTVNVGIQEAGIYIYKIMTNGIPTSGKLIITK